MIKYYLLKIKRGDITALSQIPKMWRDGVRVALELEGKSIPETEEVEEE